MNPELKKFLDLCAKMREPDFQSNVVAPYLEAIGAKNIECTHGPNERGKDFLYTVDTCYGTTDLHACVVKNGKFNARSGNSNSVQTALNQIQTSYTTVCLNPVNQKTERPRRVVFISTHKFPDTASGNLGPTIEDCKSYCTFQCGDDFASHFSELCPVLFNEMVYPGSRVTDKLSQFVSTRSEAAIFGLPQSVETGVYVELRMVQKNSHLNKFVEHRKRPKPLHTEHLPWNIVTFVREYEAILKRHILFPDILSLAPELKSPQGPSKRRANDKVHVRSIALDELYAAVLDLVQGKRSLPTSLEAGDLLFAAHELLEELLRLYGEIRLSTPVEEADVVTIGRQVDAVGILERCTDNLFIVGEPGSGKSFTARELTKRGFKEKKKVVYFPCSKVNPDHDLLDSIVNYVAATAGCSNKHASDYVAMCDTLILDGIDEAGTVEKELQNEVLALAQPEGELAVDIENEMRQALNSLPSHIKTKVRIRKDASGRFQLSPLQRLHWSEAKMIARLVGQDNNEFLSMLLPKRRIIATCRMATGFKTGSSFRKLQLLPFDDKELNEFISRNCAKAGREPSALLEFLTAHSYMRDVCRSPLTATIMLAIYLRDTDELPRTKAELYETRKDLLFSRWDQERGVKRRTQGAVALKCELLEILAYMMQKQRLVEISYGEAERMLATKNFPPQPSKVSLAVLLDDLVIHHGLIVQLGKVFSFGHLSHQEFFCAKHMVRKQKSGELAREFLNPRWRNVVIFFVGICGDTDAILKQVRSSAVISDPSLVQSLQNECAFASEYSKFLAEANEYFEQGRQEEDGAELDSDIDDEADAFEYFEDEDY